MLKIKLTIWTALILMVALTLPALAQDAASNSANNSAIEPQIKSLEADMAKLIVKGDWDSYAAHLTDDYVRTTTTGELQNKSTVMADFRSGRSKILDSIPENLEVHVYGDTAVLTGHLAELTRLNGRVTTVFSRFTSVFVKHDNVWLLAALQCTQVPK